MPTKAMKSEESISEKEMVSITNDKYSSPKWFNNSTVDTSFYWHQKASY